MSPITVFPLCATVVAVAVLAHDAFRRWLASRAPAGDPSSAVTRDEVQALAAQCQAAALACADMRNSLAAVGIRGRV